MNINLAVIDFAPGNGGGGGGSITPEEQAALDILVNSSEGVLYTKVNGAYSVTEKQMSAPNISDSYNFLEVIGGDVYYTYQDSLWKYDSDLQDFVQVGGYFGFDLKPIWKDNSGRIYSGYDYQLDIENTGSTYIQQTTGYDLRYAWSDYNRTNIFIGDKGIYDLNYSQPWGSSPTKSYKFDEETQTFKTGQNVSGVIKAANKLQPWFKYKDHYLFSNSSQIYEITEGDDEVLTTSNVDGTYFTSITLSSGRGINDFNYFVKDGILHYLDADPDAYEDTVLYVYNETTQEWDTHTLNNAKLEEGRFFVSGDFLISPSIDHTKMYIVYLGSETTKDMVWTDVKNLAVDLQSNQTIGGNKNFTGEIEAVFIRSNNGIVSNNIMLTEGNIDASNGLNVSTSSNDFIWNDKVVATRNDCFINRIVDTPGSQFEFESQLQYSNISDNWKMFYTTSSGRLLHINDYRNVCYEYDSTNREWDQINSVTNIVSSGNRVYMNAGSEIWVAKDGKVYKWNDSTTDFDYIIDIPVDYNSDHIWTGDGQTLRISNGVEDYKLTFDGNDWSWVQTNSTGLTNPYSYYADYQYFIYESTNNYMYQWDEQNQILTTLGMINVQPDDNYIAPVGNFAYYYQGYAIEKIDFLNRDFNISTNIYRAQAQWGDIPPILDFNGKYYTINQTSSNSADFGYTYGIRYEKPEVPLVDGTYTLKATVADGQVTYSWELDQSPI